MLEQFNDNVKSRIRILNSGKVSQDSKSVVYWMSRDIRVFYNWALWCSYRVSREQGKDYIVMFCLNKKGLNGLNRHYSFMLSGLLGVVKNLEGFNIPLVFLKGNPKVEVPKFLSRVSAGLLVTDFSPLKTPRKWKEDVSSVVNIPFWEVDAHNIVPCWVSSSKKEYAAYTFRPKIWEKVKDYAYFPDSEDMKFKKDNMLYLKYSKSIANKDLNVSGEKTAFKMFEEFLEERFSEYSKYRNDPTQNATSRLSSYLHFGMISALQIYLRLKDYNQKKIQDSKESFWEELIVRKELSDNFCFYEKNYKKVEGFPRWAFETLKKHEQDEREYIYELNSFEKAATHDTLWNAAQEQMLYTGYMHGFMRMYWAKKILEWTPNIEDALEIAIYLNNKYELDGRDANGYTGIAWAIGGVHDRAWFERPIFGKVRFMNRSGAERKFDVDAYIYKINSMKE